MATVKSFTELNVWQNARELNRWIFKKILSNSEIHDHPLKDQLNGAAGSVMDNIAEGFGRGGTREFVQFLGFSHGSLLEAESQLYRCLDRGYFSREDHEEVSRLIKKLTGMIIAFMNYLKKSDFKGVKYKVEEPGGVYGMPEIPHSEFISPQTKPDQNSEPET